MKKFFAASLAICGIGLASTALADWHTVSVKDLNFVTDSSAPDPGVRLTVTGTFSPSLPCTSQAFFLLPNDPLFKEVYAMLLTAQNAGSQIRYFHIYCYPNGVGRGNSYTSLGP